MLLVHGLFVFSVKADLTEYTGQLSKDADSAEVVRKLFEAEDNAICGGGQIRKLLTDVPSPSSFRCNKWDTIEATADAYLESVKVDIEKLVKEAARLEEEIRLATEKSAPKEWDITGSAKPVLESILTEAFISPETAKEVRCGQAPYSIRKKKGVKAKAFRTARALMPEKLEAVFKDGQVRVGDSQGDSMRILQMCGSILGWNPEQKQDDDSYCDELCSNFARDALELSAKYAGSYAGKGAKELEEQLEKVRGDLKYSRDEEDECKRAKQALGAFTSQLEQLNKDIDVKHKLRMAAQENLDEAEEGLDEMAESLDEKSDVLARAEEDLGLKKARAAEMTSLVAAEKAQEKIKNEAVKVAQGQLAAAKKELAEASAASVALDEIKGLVTQTMLKMVAHHEVAVVKPVQKLGLKLATDISEYFDGVMDEATAEKEAVYSTLTLMDKYCESTAIPHFKTVQSSLDLMPLCPKGNAEEIGSQIDTMVKKRASEVQAALESVRNALDVYRGQNGMSKEESDRLTSLGELEGLREVATVYAESSYYSRYLQHWKLDAEPPKFLDLVSSLKDAVARLIEQGNKLGQALKDAEQAAAKQLEKRKKAIALLKEAIKNNEVAQAKEAAARQEVGEQEKMVEEAEADLEKLMAASKAAQKAYNDAKNALMETYQTGTNLA